MWSCHTITTSVPCIDSCAHSRDRDEFTSTPIDLSDWDIDTLRVQSNVERITGGRALQRSPLARFNCATLGSDSDTGSSPVGTGSTGVVMGYSSGFGV